MLLPSSAEDGLGFLAVSGVRKRVQGPPQPLLLTVRPQAELATSHKCLSHEVKRLTEENQGLRAEQPPSSAARGLEQEDGHEESLPSSVPVSGVWVPRARRPPRWPFPCTRGKALACSQGTWGQTRAALYSLRHLAKSLDCVSGEQAHSPFAALA